MFNVKASLALGGGAGGGGGEIRMRDGEVMIGVGRELDAATPEMLPEEEGKGQTWILPFPLPTGQCRASSLLLVKKTEKQNEKKKKN